MLFLDCPLQSSNSEVLVFSESRVHTLCFGRSLDDGYSSLTVDWSTNGAESLVDFFLFSLSKLFVLIRDFLLFTLSN